MSRKIFPVCDGHLVAERERGGEEASPPVAVERDKPLLGTKEHLRGTKIIKILSIRHSKLCHLLENAYLCKR